MVDTNCNTHEHVLWSLCNFSIETKEVRALERLEAEVIVVEIALVINVVVQHFSIGHNNVIDLFRDEWSMFLRFRVDVFSKVGNDIREHIFGRTVQVIDADTGSKLAVVRVL